LAEISVKDCITVSRDCSVDDDDDVINDNDGSEEGSAFVGVSGKTEMKIGNNIIKLWTFACDV
jgi:hypothetical protein